MAARSLLRRLIRCERAAAAVEFALVGPAMLLLVLAIIENGLMLFGQAVLDNATSAAARQVQIGNITSSAAFQTAVCNGVSGFLTCANINVYVAFGTSSFPAAAIPSSTGTFLAVSTGPGIGSSYVLAEAAYNRTYIAPMLVALDAPGWVLLSARAFQNEPFS